MRDTLITSAFSGPWYNDDDFQDVGFTDNKQNFLVSIPRLRQVRVEKSKSTSTLHLNNTYKVLFTRQCMHGGNNAKQIVIVCFKNCRLRAGDKVWSRGTGISRERRNEKCLTFVCTAVTAA